jgi:hypothetical protein
MKPYGVLSINADESEMWSFAFDPNARRRNQGLDFDEEPPQRPQLDPETGRILRNGRILVYVDGQQVKVDTHEAQDFDCGQICYFTDTQADAETLAGFLARRNPQNRYMTFRTSHVFHAPPGEVQRAEFNEKGLLPS